MMVAQDRERLASSYLPHANDESSSQNAASKCQDERMESDPKSSLSQPVLEQQIQASEDPSTRTQQLCEMSCEKRMKRLKHQLFSNGLEVDEKPASFSSSPSSPSSSSSSPSSCDQPQSNATHIDLQQVQAIVFYGIHEDFVSKKRKRLRPLAWRLLLNVLVPDVSQWKPVLNQQRNQYLQYKRQFMYRHSRPQDQIASLGGTDDEEADDGDDLLQEQSFRRDIALVREIEKDVSRTQSNVSFFALGGLAQKWMLSVLFVYAKLNPEVGYVQGMNEIVAPLVYTFGTDPCKEWSLQAEADVFVAFESIMKSAKLLFMKSPHDANKMGVDHQMERLELLLRQHDAVLWQHLNSIGLNASFYSFKWYMTLLAREFPIEMTLRVWDALLADTRRFSFLHYVNCALLKSQRKSLLEMDFCMALKHLQMLSSLHIDLEKVLADAEQMRSKDRTVDDQRRRSLS